MKNELGWIERKCWYTALIEIRRGQYIGLVVDYVNALSIELGVEIKYEPLLWSTALEKLAKGETDFSDMFPSKERAEKFFFTDPLYNLRGIIIVGTENEDVQSIDDLKEKIVAIPEGDYAIDFLRKRNPDQHILLTRDNDEALEMVRNKEAVAVVGDEPVLSYFLNKSDHSAKFKILPKPAYEMECVFAVPKTERRLVSILNKGIYALKNKDMMLKIQQKWLGVSASFVQAQQTERVLLVLASLVVFMILILYVFTQWNRTLKREVTKRTEELIMSRNELQTTFDGLYHFLVVFDQECRIVNINRSFCSFLGKKKEDILQHNCPSIRGAFLGDCTDCIVSESFREGKSLRTEITAGGGIYQLSTYPIELKRVEVQKVLLMVRDVTNEKLTEKKYFHDNKMAAIGQLAAGMAHEIRNPLGLIRNYSYIIRKSANSHDSYVLNNIALIESSVEKASGIIDNLLNFSRLDNEVLENICLHEFIEGILLLEKKVIQKKGIKAVIDCPDSIHYCINREVLKHILINLVGNAIDAMPEGGTFEIRVRQDEESLIIECEDSGVGIKQKNIDSIFNPFFSTKKRGNGTGLGLYIVHSDVKRYGGEISVESTYGVGTIFTVSLPYKLEAEYEATEKTQYSDYR